MPPGDHSANEVHFGIISNQILQNFKLVEIARSVRCSAAARPGKTQRTRQQRAVYLASFGGKLAPPRREKGDTMKELFQIEPGVSERGKRSIFAWNPSGSHLAASTAGAGACVKIYDRSGKETAYVELGDNGGVISLEWDTGGGCLSILHKDAIVTMWEASSQRTTSLETDMQEHSFMKWSSNHILAIGNQQGNLLLYDSREDHKVPVFGKHSGAITCGVWRIDGRRLALGSKDGTITLSNERGDTLEQTNLKHEALHMAMSDGAKTDVAILAINDGGKSLLLIAMDESASEPIEHTYNPSYGSITSFAWVSNQSLLVGFSSGRLVAVSSPMTDAKMTDCSTGSLRGSISNIGYSPSVQSVAVSGEENKAASIFSVSKNGQCTSEADDSFDVGGRIKLLKWSGNGVLTASISGGSIRSFLRVSSLPRLHASHGSSVAVLSSLKEITLTDTSSKKGCDVFQVNLEPAILSLGPSHFAVGSGDRVIFYRRKNGHMIGDRVYGGPISGVVLNETYAAVLCDGKACVHRLDKSGQVTVFPTDQTKREDTAFDLITCIELTQSFLIHGTASGTIKFFSLEDWDFVNGLQFQHACEIKQIYPNAPGTRLILVDATDEGFLYSPVSTDVTPIPSFPPAATHVMWDHAEKNIFMVFEREKIHSYVYSPASIHGALLLKIGPLEVDSEGSVSMIPESISIDEALEPLVFNRGKVVCRCQQSELKSIYITEHCDTDILELTKDQVLLVFTQNLALLRLDKAWEAALVINENFCWLGLAHTALKVLELDLAIRVYQQLGDAGMFLSFDDVRGIEDKKLLAGHIAVSFSDYDLAQDFFLASSLPRAALTMRRDLRDFQEAMSLAQTRFPDAVSAVSLEYAFELDCKGDYDGALQLFEQSLATAEEDGANSEHVQACIAGIAKCSIHVGDVSNGIRMAKEAKDVTLQLECAKILEPTQAEDAAILYELAGDIDKAVELFIDNNHLDAASAIIGKVSQKSTLRKYAKLCEESRQYDAAAKIYLRANDVASVVRLYLDKLQKAEEAFDLVKSSRCPVAAVTAAEHCERNDNLADAIEFFMIADARTRAFALAKERNCMDEYVKSHPGIGGSEEALCLAEYYESNHLMGKAAKFYSLGCDYEKALTLFVQCEDFDGAIGVIGEAKDDALTHQLIDALMGESGDGRPPRDPVYVYKLYLSLRNYKEAAKTAILIADQLMQDGEYDKARMLVVDIISSMELQRVSIPRGLWSTFNLLHSYHLVKTLANKQDHEGTARLLLRVAKQISRFPRHQVRILISVVLECTKAGLHRSAFETSSLICSNKEFKEELMGTKFKKKIQSIVRRPNKDEKAEEKTPCPISNQPTPSTSLVCPDTKQQIPMCICTGKHMVLEDWTFCPISRLPALLSEYKRYISAESKNEKGDTEQNSIGQLETDGKELERTAEFALDPVFGKQVSSLDLCKSSTAEALEYIKRYNTFVDSTS